MRTIQYIAIHCTATQQSATIDSIKKYWKEVLGWKVVGYHYLIKLDGEIVNLLPIEEVSNGVQGYNSVTINVCYIGGIDKLGKALDTRTDEQKVSLTKIIRELKIKFPQAIVQGHRDFPNVKKECPCFNAKNEYKFIK